MNSGIDCYCFLILHYNDVDVTVRCVDSINQLESDRKKEIVIVDNASNNNSYSVLMALYGGQESIHLIHVKEGKGFSHGNNIGFYYVKKNFSPRFLLVCNNDIIFHQKDFLKRLNKIYGHSQFFLMGPDIINMNNHQHQNPMRNFPRDIDEVDKWIRGMRKELKYIHITCLKKQLREWLGKFKIYQDLRNIKHHISPNGHSYQEGVCLQGACLVFAKKAIKQLDALFWPETFFYCEEEILCSKFLSRGWKIVYDSGAKILHGDSVATRSKFSNMVQRHKYGLENTIHSAMIYRAFLENTE